MAGWGLLLTLLNFDATVEVLEWINNFIPYFTGCNFLSMTGSKLIHASKRGPSSQVLFDNNYITI